MEAIVLTDGQGNVFINIDGNMIGDETMPAIAEGDNYTETTIAISGAGYPSSCNVSLDGNILFVGMSEAPYMARYIWNNATQTYDYVDSGIDALNAKPTAIRVASDGLTMAVGIGATYPGLVTFKWNIINDRFEVTNNINVSLNLSGYGSIYTVEVNNDGSIISISNYNSPKFDSFKWNASNYRYERTAVPLPAAANASYAHTATPDGMIAVSTYQSTSPYVTTYSWIENNNRYEGHSPIDIAPASSASAGAYISADGSRMSVGSWNGFYSYMWSVTNNRYEKTADPTPQLSMPIRFYSDDEGETLVACDASGDYGGQFVMFLYKWIAANNRYEQIENAFTPEIHPSFAGGCFSGPEVGRLVIAGGTAAYPRLEVYPPHI